MLQFFAMGVRIRRISPEWPLRIGLGFTYLYSGLDLFRHPSGWLWAIIRLPEGIRNVIARIGEETFLRTQGLVELTLAALFLIWFLPRSFLRFGAFISMIQMAAIIALVGIRGETFRDIAILGGALSLFLFSFRPSIFRSHE